MANETPITVIGNLTADPELRFTPNGAAVANFTVASTPRTFDRQANEWKDGETMFLRCSVWREEAENVADSLTKGTRVIVNGRLKARGYTDREGNERTSWEIDVDEVGPSLKFATAKISRAGRGAPRGGQGGHSAPQGGQGGQGGAWGGPPSNGGHSAPQGGQGGGFAGPGNQSGGFGGPQGGAPAAGDPWGGQGGGWDTPAGAEPSF